jgi:N-acetylmuramic acid 6-phosphate etherase
MVDLRATNLKLQDRSVRIVQMLTGLSRSGTIDLLRSADGEVKTAIVMRRRGVPAAEARQLLHRCGQSLRTAIESAANQSNSTSGSSRGTNG